MHEAMAARALRRKDNVPVTADEESFTAARRHPIRSKNSAPGASRRTDSYERGYSVVQA